MKAVTARWQQEEFELWGDREGPPGPHERIDNAVPPEMRQGRHVDLDPRDLGTLQFWQDPQRLSRRLRWFRLHYVPKPPVETESVDKPAVEARAASEPVPTLTPGQLRELSREQTLEHGWRLVAQLREQRLSRKDAVIALIDAGFDQRATHLQWDDFRVLANAACPHLYAITSVRQYQELAKALRPIS